MKALDNGKGNRAVVVVHITARDSEMTYSAAELSTLIFGNGTTFCNNIPKPRITMQHGIVSRCRHRLGTLFRCLLHSSSISSSGSCFFGDSLLVLRLFLIGFFQMLTRLFGTVNSPSSFVVSLSFVRWVSSLNSQLNLRVLLLSMVLSRVLLSAVPTMAMVDSRDDR